MFAWILRIMRRIVDKRREQPLLLRTTGKPPVLDLGEHCQYHLFLSHVWATGQDQVAVIKRRLLELMPHAKIFLDVEDLESIAHLEKYIEQSASVMIFLSRGYFLSQNCLREANHAVDKRKNILLMHERDKSRGGTALDKVVDECPAILREPIFRGNQVIPWLRLGHLQRESLCCLAEGMLKALPTYRRSGAGDGAELSLMMPGALVEFDWALPSPVTLYCSSNNPGALEVGTELVDPQCPLARIYGGLGLTTVPSDVLAARPDGASYRPTLQRMGSRSQAFSIGMGKAPKAKRATGQQRMKEVSSAYASSSASKSKKGAGQRAAKDRSPTTEAVLSLHRNSPNEAAAFRPLHPAGGHPSRNQVAPAPEYGGRNGGVQPGRQAAPRASPPSSPPQATETSQHRAKIAMKDAVPAQKKSKNSRDGLTSSASSGKASSTGCSAGLERPRTPTPPMIAPVPQLPAAAPDRSRAPSPFPEQPTHFLLLLNNKTFAGDYGKELAHEVRAAGNCGMPILLVHQAEQRNGGVDFERFFHVTPTDLINSGIYRSLAVPWHTGSHVNVSRALAAQALGAEKVVRDLKEEKESRRRKMSREKATPGTVAQEDPQPRAPGEFRRQVTHQGNASGGSCWNSEVEETLNKYSGRPPVEDSTKVSVFGGSVASGMGPTSGESAASGTSNGGRASPKSAMSAQRQRIKKKSR